MDPFKSFCLTWWQAVLWKTAMVSLGMAVGANWPRVQAWTGPLVAVALLTGGYVTVVWLAQ